MGLFNSFVTLEPCRITRVDTDKMLATVRGYRNIGEMSLPWTDYAHPGTFLDEDAHYGGRIPKEGAIALVIAEWSSLDKTLLKAYIIGYIPATSLDFSSEGVTSFRNEYHGPQTTGGVRFTTSTKSQLDLDDSGNVTIESTPQNYRKMSPEDNKIMEVCENYYQMVSGYVNRITYDEHGNNETRYERVVAKKNTQTEYNVFDDRDKALRDSGQNNSGNVVFYEEIGGNIDKSYLVYPESGAELPNGFGKPYYKFTIVNNGNPVYTKMIDESGNVFESIKGNYTFNVSGTVIFKIAVDFFIYVTNLLYQKCMELQWYFNNATGNSSGGIVNWFASRINFWKS